MFGLLDEGMFGVQYITLHKNISLIVYSLGDAPDGKDIARFFYVVHNDLRSSLRGKDIVSLQSLQKGCSILKEHLFLRTVIWSCANKLMRIEPVTEQLHWKAFVLLLRSGEIPNPPSGWGPESQSLISPSC